MNRIRNFQYLRLVLSLVYFCVFLGCILFTVSSIKTRGMFEYVGVDYRLWYSTGNIIRFHGVDKIYDSDLQSKYQAVLFNDFSKESGISMPFWSLPLPYLSVFTLPLVLLSYLSPLTGFILWTLINLFTSIAYMVWFCKRIQIKVNSPFILASLVSLPFFLNFLFGQLNLMLLISTGEFLINVNRGKDYSAGVWLSGLLLKPQNLILVIPGLLYLKKWKMLFGFGICGLLIVLTSFFLVGVEGLRGLFNTIWNWPTVLGDSGMNFRSFAVNMERNMPPFLTTFVLYLFTCVVIFFTIRTWVSHPRPDKSSFIGFSGLFFFTLIATLIIAPHSNVHMAMLLIPFMLVLVPTELLDNWILHLWLLLPIGAFLILSPRSAGLAHSIGGMFMLFVNISLLLFMQVQRASNRKILNFHD